MRTPARIASPIQTQRPQADILRAVSEENAELVRERYRRFAAGENPPDWYARDFVWDMSTFTNWPERQQYFGAAGVQEFLASWLEAWDDWRLELEEALEAGDGRVVAICSQYGRSKATGLEAEMHFAQLWTLEDGRYVRMEMYAEPGEALRVAGLSR